MTVTLVTVTGNLETLSGATPSLGRVWFRLNRPDWNLSGDIFAPEYIEAIADTGTGAFSVALQASTDFEAGASYSVLLKYREPLDNKDREYLIGRFALPSGGPYELGDLLTVPFVEPVPADILALCQAYAVSAETDAASAAASAELARVAADEAAADRDFVEAAAGGIGVARRVYLTWLGASGLVSAVGTVDGEGAEVLPADAGTHTDPVVGGTVANAGVYKWVVASTAWQRVASSGLATETAARIAGDKLNLFEFSSVASADGLAYTATVTGPSLTKAEVEDGNPRLFVFQPNVTNTGAVTIQVGGAGTVRLVRTQNDLPLVAGQLVAGVRYMLVGDGTRFYTLGKYAEVLGDPTQAQIASAVLNAATATDARRQSQRYVLGLSPADYDPIVMPNEPGPLFVGLQGNGHIVHIIRAGQDIDLNFVKPGSTVRLIVRNSGGTAAARLQIPSGAAVLGPAASTFYDVTNGSLIEVVRSSSGSVDLFSLRALHGSIAVASSLTDAARARGIIFGGQSLALRFTQGYGPMALQTAFSDLALTASTRIVQTAAGSSSLFFANESGGGNYWWDERTNIAGPLAIAAVATINAHLAAKPVGEPDPAMMVFNIGQNDADNIANSGTTTIATVRDHYRKVMAYIRTNTGLAGLITAIDLLGSDDGGAYTDAQCSMFRRAQLAACKDDVGVDDPLIRPGIETFDLPRLWDDVHICLPGQTLQAQRYADLWQSLIAVVAAKKQGLEIINHTFTAPNQHTVRVLSSDWAGVKYGTRRPVSQIPGGFAFLPNAVPSTADAPFVLAAWSITGTGITNELEFNFFTAIPSTGAVCVTNWGRGANEALQSRNVRDVLTDRSLLTRDPRPIV